MRCKATSSPPVTMERTRSARCVWLANVLMWRKRKREEDAAPRVESSASRIAAFGVQFLLSLEPLWLAKHPSFGVGRRVSVAGRIDVCKKMPAARPAGTYWEIAPCKLPRLLAARWDG